MSENRNGTRYHEMDAGCMAAFRDFLGKANALPGVRVHLTGVYRRAYNDVQKQEGKAGTRLVLEFSGAPSNQTYYTFRMPELHGKNQYAKSLHLVPDGKNDPVEAFTGVSGKAARGNVAPVKDGRAAAGMNYAVAKAMNSMDFSGLFRDGHDVSTGWVEESPGYQRKADLAVAMRGHDADEALAGIFGKLSRGEDIPGYPGSGTDPKFVSAALNIRHMGDAETVSGTPKLREAEKARYREIEGMLGLDDLYGVLSDISSGLSRRPLEAPDLDGYFSDGARGRRAAQGLSNLCFLKHVVDDGDYVVRDKRGAVVTAGVREEPDNPSLDKSGIFYRGCMASDEAAIDREIQRKNDEGRSDTVPLFAYQKLRHDASQDAGFDRSRIERLRDYDRYRLFRSAALGEDFGKPSGMPRVTVGYSGDLDGRLTTDNLTATLPDGNTVPLAEYFTNPQYGVGPQKDRLFGSGRFPMISYALQKEHDGFAGVMTNALKILDPKNKVTPMDLAELEFAIFTDPKRGPEWANNIVRGATGGQRTMDDVEHEFYRNRLRSLDASGGKECFRILGYSLETATGYPSIEKGCTRFGRCQAHDAGIDGWKPPVVGRPSQTANGFRRADAERAMYDQKFHGETSPSAKLYNDTVGAMSRETLAAPNNDAAVRGSSRMNDFIVLCECYGGDSAERIQVIRDDVDRAYNGFQGQMLYRPKDRLEAECVGAVFGPGVPLGAAAVPYGSQKTDDGFLSALRRGIEAQGPEAADGLKGKVLRSMATAALQSDTQVDPRYGDLSMRAHKELPGEAESSITLALAKPVPTDHELLMGRLDRAAAGVSGQDGPERTDEFGG